jgi:hypothetical protein
MNVELLNLLADRLEKLPPEGPGFNMCSWGNRPSYHACDTTACAMGHAALMPEFQELGLSAQDSDGNKLLTAEQFNKVVLSEAEVIICFNDEGGGYPAAQNLFGITDVAALYLFGPSGISASEEAHRIRKFIEGAIE